MIRTMLLAAALIATTGVAQAQRWEDRYERRSIPVEAADLDLSNDAGIRTLEGRVAKAVNRICGSDRDCRDEAWASTDDQVAWAISRDRWTRRMAEEREAQLRDCGWDGCERRGEVIYEPVEDDYPPPAPPPPPAGGVHVVIVYSTAPPIEYRR
ncbi:UrcA family protein [Sphingomonas sp. HF-S3]|uniref:UrcA family protein n=1 Tax=Sphingomonas rustica TaxID=3103142 RepID=A0ABV0BDY5_9SPHN